MTCQAEIGALMYKVLNLRKAACRFFNSSVLLLREFTVYLYILIFTYIYISQDTHNKNISSEAHNQMS